MRVVASALSLALVATVVVVSAWAVVRARSVNAQSATISSATADNWPTYQHDVGRTAASGDTILSAANTGQILPQWTYKTGGGIEAEPTIVNGIAYIGSWDGYEYAINALTGKLIWKTWLGQTVVTNPGCNMTIGISSSAAVQNGMVYVGGGDSYWYALNATDGSIAWKVFVGDNSNTGGYYNWSSPAVANGYAYVGTASLGDCPLVQGQVLQISLTTHQIINTFNLVPNGQTGAGVWTSPAVDVSSNTVYVSTGNSYYAPGNYGQSIVALDATTLALKDYWQAPWSQAAGDSDFGTTPVLFTDSGGRQLVAAINKNGIVYALLRANLSAGPVWETQVAIAGSGCPECGDGSVSSMTFANGRLFAAGGNTTIGALSYGGSVSALDPTTGAFLWRRGEANMVLAPLTSDNGIVFASPGPLMEALDMATGNQLFSFPVGYMYAGVSVSNGQVMFGDTNGTLYNLALPSTCPAGWGCADVGTPTLVGAQSLSSSTWTLQGAGADIWNTTDQFHYVWQSLPTNGVLTVHVSALDNTNGWAKAGLMARVSTDPNAPFYDVVVTPSNGVSVQWRTSAGASAQLAPSVSGAAPIWLRLSRSGTTYSAYTSADGVTWTVVSGSTMTLPNLTGTLLGGMAVTSHNSGQLANATFDSLRLTPSNNVTCPAVASAPSGWNCSDIGWPALRGSQTFTSGTWTLQGAGTDISNTSDQFHYVWQNLPADGTLTAHVSSLGNTNGWAKAGLMARQSTDPAAPFYDVVVTPSNGVSVQWRTSFGVSAQLVQSVSGTTPIWLKMIRSGTTYSAYTSADGVTWTLVPNSTINLPNLTGTLLWGLAVTSHNPWQTTTATFDTFTAVGTALKPLKIAKPAKKKPTATSTLPPGPWSGG